MKGLLFKKVVNAFHLLTLCTRFLKISILSLLLYDFFLKLYFWSVWLAAPFQPKAKKFIKGRKGLFQKLKKDLSGENREIIWMHCASLGEFEQGRPLLEAIRKKYPQYALLLTFFSPSGFETRKDYTGADFIFYLPTDSKKNAQKFLEITQPKMALFVKYEFWYHYLKALNRSHIPAILFSAHFQKNQPFFQFYGRLFREMLDNYEQIFVQDERSERLLLEIGKSNVRVSGDTRFDRTAIVSAAFKDFPKVICFKQKKKLIIAGSSWQEDEIFLKKVLNALPGNDFKLLIVPHETHHQNIERILKFFTPDVCLWNDEEGILGQKKVAVVNTIGQLSFLYRYADVAWVGGGFGKGIHNILEPGAFGIPVFFGPNFKRFNEAIGMCEKGGAESVSEVNKLVAFLEDAPKLDQMGKAAGAYVASHLGATEEIMNYLSEKYFSKVE